jgi:hypothetical protein
MKGEEGPTEPDDAGLLPKPGWKTLIDDHRTSVRQKKWLALPTTKKIFFHYSMLTAKIFSHHLATQNVFWVNERQSNSLNLMNPRMVVQIMRKIQRNGEAY